LEIVDNYFNAISGSGGDDETLDLLVALAPSHR